MLLIGKCALEMESEDVAGKDRCGEGQATLGKAERRQSVTDPIGGLAAGA